MTTPKLEAAFACPACGDAVEGVLEPGPLEERQPPGIGFKLFVQRTVRNHS